MDRGAWQGTVHGVPKSRTQLSDEHLLLRINLNIFQTVVGNGSYHEENRKRKKSCFRKSGNRWGLGRVPF